LFLGALFALAPLASVHSQDDGPQDSGRNKVHLPISDEASGFLEGAQKAAKDGDFDRAADLVRTVLDRDLDSRCSNQVVPLEEAPGEKANPDGPRRYVGVTERAIQVLRALPPEARDAFRKKFDYRAKAAFTAALDATDPVRELLRVYDHFPVATCAPELLSVAADRSFERGELDRARRLYERLLRDHRAELKSPPLVREKLLAACIFSGRRTQVERLLDEAVAEDKDYRVHLNGAALTRDEVLALSLKNEAVAKGDAAPPAGEGPARASLALPRGDSANRAVFARPVKVGAPRFQRPREFEPQIDPFDGHTFHASRLDRYGDPGPARHLPVIWNDTIFVVTADRIRAFSLDGLERPEHIAQLSQADRYPDDNPNVQFGAAVERGVLVAPYVDRVQEEQAFRGIPIKVKIPERKLAGFDLERWRWKWNHKEALAGTRLESASFPCAPVTEDGTCFVSCFAIEGFVHCYAAAFDPETGALRWSTWIASGQVEQTMFGEHAREPLCAPCAVVDGVVYDATQMGCLAAMDADTGRIKWLSEYEQLEVHAAKGYYPDPRNIIWENNPPVVESGTVVIAPMDSELYFFFDAETGKKIYQSRKSFEPAPENRYLLGASQGRVVVSGTSKVVCLDVKTGKLLWTQSLLGKTVSGRGVLAGGKVVVPASDELHTFDLMAGTNEGGVPMILTGNLAVAGDSVVVTGDNQVSAFVNERPEKNANRGRDF
jgi:outer membrane protein assembly factor BamB